MAPNRLCFIGDSFVQGCGDPTLLGWVGRVCAQAIVQGHDLTVYNLGIRGQTSGDIAERWHAEALSRLSAQSFDHRGLVFSFGANDAAQGVTLDHTRTHTEAILDQAQGMAPILLVGPAPIADTPSADSHLADICTMMAHCAQCRGIAYLPVFTDLRQNRTWMDEAPANDGAHPGVGGYSVLADRVHAWSAWQGWFR